MLLLGRGRRCLDRLGSGSLIVRHLSIKYFGKRGSRPIFFITCRHFSRE
jgi:hypothetical protein